MGAGFVAQNQIVGGEIIVLAKGEFAGEIAAAVGIGDAIIRQRMRLAIVRAIELDKIVILR